jgi:hypothetical protein
MALASNRVDAMSALRRRGFMVADGPFRFNEIAKIASDYDHAFAVTPDAQIKRGRISTRWGGLVDRSIGPRPPPGSVSFPRGGPRAPD